MGQKLTTHDIAQRLGIAQRAVRRWIANGDLPAELFGKTYVVELEDLEFFLVNKKKPGRPRKLPLNWSP